MKQSRRLLSLAKHSEIMNLREEEIGRIIEQLSKKTDGFENPTNSTTFVKIIYMASTA